MKRKRRPPLTPEERAAQERRWAARLDRLFEPLRLGARRALRDRRGMIVALLVAVAAAPALAAQELDDPFAPGFAYQARTAGREAAALAGANAKRLDAREINRRGRVAAGRARIPQAERADYVREFLVGFASAVDARR